MKFTCSQIFSSVLASTCLATASFAFGNLPFTSAVAIAGFAVTQPADQQPKKDEPQKDEPKKDEAKPAAPQGTPASRSDQPGTSEPIKEKVLYFHMQTSMGDIFLELDHEKAPISSANFAQYVEKGFYNGTIFHRVIPNFMIQGGGMTADMTEKPTGATIKNEWQNGLKNRRGTVAMARKGAGPDSPNSATSQFFINVVDNEFLDRAQSDGAAYAVFGKVVGGMDVVDKIKASKTSQRGPHANVPVTPVVIEKVEKISKEQLDAGLAKKN